MDKPGKHTSTLFIQGGPGFLFKYLTAICRRPAVRNRPVNVPHHEVVYGNDNDSGGAYVLLSSGSNWTIISVDHHVTLALGEVTRYLFLL